MFSYIQESCTTVLNIFDIYHFWGETSIFYEMCIIVCSPPAAPLQTSSLSSYLISSGYSQLSFSHLFPLVTLSSVNLHFTLNFHKNEITPFDPYVTNDRLEQYSIVYVYHISFIQSSAEGYSGCFHFWGDMYLAWQLLDHTMVLFLILGKPSHSFSIMAVLIDLSGNVHIIANIILLYT